MKIVSDDLQDIATTLGMQYIRSYNLTEADNEIHHLATDLPLMIYNGAASIAVEFSGAQIIDVITVEIYFFVRMSAKDMLAKDIDTLLDTTKRLADQTYAILNEEPHPKDIEPYTLDSVEPQFTDLYIGHQMTIGLPYYNTGC